MAEYIAGLRRTRQRDEIHAALSESEVFRSAQQIHADLRSGGSETGLATVYRVLQALADGNEVDVMRLPNGERLYRRCGVTNHHHHLVCRRCGYSVEVQDLGVGVRAEHLATQHGFTDVAHTVEIFGTCAACSGGAG